MRRAYDSEIVLKDGQFYGINLGADFVSEHEWGIKGIVDAFKIHKEKIGIEGRCIQAIPETLIFKNVCVKNKQFAFLGIWSYRNANITERELSSLELLPFNDEKHMSTSWDEDSFGILVDETYREQLETLYNAFKKKDIVVGVSPAQVFQNGGLKFLIKSLLPEELIKNTEEADLDKIRLKEAAQATGIYEILKAANKEYFALSPRWGNDQKTEVKFWLNPQNQSVNNAGWYTVQDLKDWAQDKGKVISKK